MTISFAGQPMLLEAPSGEVSDFISKYWSLPTSMINAPPRRIDARSLCQQPAWPPVPNLKINQLYQPSGATRWSRCLLLCDDVAMNSIKDLRYGMLRFGGGYPCTPAYPIYGTTPSVGSGSATSGGCSLANGKWNIGGDFNLTMFKLDPIPVSVRGDGGLYLVPLVDERYFWQGINLISSRTEWYVAPSSSSSSSGASGLPDSLFSDIITSLASNAVGSPLPKDYIAGDVNPLGTPSCLAFRNGMIPAAAALDLLCWSQGLLLVPEDYHHTTFLRTDNYMQRYRVIGSGNATGDTPISIYKGNKAAVQYNRSLQSAAGNDKYGSAAADYPLSIDVHFNNPCDPSQRGYLSAVSAPVVGSSSSSGSSSSGPAPSPTTGTNPVMSVHCLATSDAPLVNPDDDPDNVDDLDEIALAWANRWYAGNLIDFDWTFTGMPILKFCGREDYILLDQSLRKKGRYGAFTRWVSLPSHYGYEYVAIETAAHKDDCCLAATSGGGGGGGTTVGCGCCNCFNCIPASQATVGGCAAAPNGAAYQMLVNIGRWAAYPEFTPGGVIVLTYGSPTGCGVSSSNSSSSSSSSSSSGATSVCGPPNPVVTVDDGCVWYSCPFTLRKPPDSSSSSSKSSSSSSSSSGSPNYICGTYQWQARIYTGMDGEPAFKCVPKLLAGVDWLGIAEDLP